jgi:uncharacterized repeat protein (TIGR01451 family)
MLRRTRVNRRAVLGVIAAAAGLSIVATMAPAQAATDAAASSAAAAKPAAVTKSGPYSADADVSMLTVGIPEISPAILPLTQVDVAHSTATADSDADKDAAKPGDQRTFAIARTTGDTNLLDADINLASNQASAPASEAHEQVLLDLDLSPLLDLPVIRTTALANWVSDTECVDADTPLSFSDQALADLTLLGGAALPGGGSVADLNTENAEGAADAEVSTYLAAINGPGKDQRAVQSRIKTDVTSLDVLNNLAGSGNVIHADVVQNPNYTVSASGLPGGATITGPDPAVDVSIGGTPVATVVAGGDEVDAQLLDLNVLDLLDVDTTTGFVSDLLLDLLGPAAQPLIDSIIDPIDDAVEMALEALHPIARLSIPLDKQMAADGTSASVKGALLKVELIVPLTSSPLAPVVDDVVNAILDALGADISKPLVDLEVAPFEGKVTAPAGGIDCGENNPLRELNKHASALEVAPGGTFDYNIAVPNRGPCAVTGVKVTDVVSGPKGFEIVSTEPAATSNTNGTLTFDLGDLAVNQTKNITITVKVPTTAKNNENFDDNVTVTGTCNGKPVTQDDKVVDIPVVKTNFVGECSVQNSNKDASHLQVFPGETFSYYVHAFNSGGKPCSNVKIVDTLDARLTFVSCNKNCTHEGNTVTWTIPTLGAGSSSILSVVVQVKDDASGKLANSAIITPEGHTPKTVTTTGPTIGPTSIPKDPVSPSRGLLPRTGLAIPMTLTLLAGALGYGLLELRRRAGTATLS